MSDLGSGIRRYYEEIVERVDPSVPQVMAGPVRAYSMRAGVGLAVLVGLLVLLVFGLVLLVIPSEPDPVAPPTTATPTTVASTIRPAELAGPSVIVTSDGVEIGSISDSGIADSFETQNLFEYVVRELTSNEDYWPLGSDPAELLGLYPDSPQTGITVEITVDTAIQRIVESVVSDWRTDTDTVISVVVVDNQTGRIVAAGPGSSARGDAFDPERMLPAASLAQVYTAMAALEAGYAIDSEWDGSSPQTFTSPSWEDEWIVHNTGADLGLITLDSAIYRAVNTVFANIGMELGPEAIIDITSRLGLNLRGLENLPRPANPPVNAFTPLEAVATGAGEITTFDAAAMFATISRSGTLTPSVIIETITGPDGQVIYQAPSSGERTIDSEVIQGISSSLAKVPTPAGTASRANIGIPQIGKTGTADNFLTAWYAGSTDRYTAAVSVIKLGPSNELLPLQDVEISGQVYAMVFGGSVPAPIWAEIMTELHDLP